MKLPPQEERLFSKWHEIRHDPKNQINQQFQKFSDAINDRDRQKGILPPCPDCGGKMKAWDAWLITGATCIDCGWNYSEGTGCLAE